MSDWLEAPVTGLGFESAGGPSGQRPAASNSEPGAEPSGSARPDSGEPKLGGPGISEELATRAVADEAFAEAQGVPPAPEGLDPDASEAAEAARVAARERDEYREALVRLQADFENYKKRIAKQQQELRDRAAEALIEKLLPVLDTADLALAHGGGEDVKQICSALFSALEREGLERIDELGATFDPTLHDAVAHEPGDGHTQEVAEIMRAGYRWRGRVLRPAMVKVRG